MPFSSADPNAFFALGPQSALGTPQTTAAKLRFAKYLAGTEFNIEPENIYLREGGDGLDFGYGYKQRQKSSGNIVVNARPEIIGQILAAIPGGATWDGGSAPALHTFHTGHASFAWQTIVAQHPGSDIGHLISDALFTGFTLEANAGDPWQLTLPFIAVNHGASIAAFSPTYASEEPFLFQHTPSYRVDGAADTTVSGFTITHTFGMEELYGQSFKPDVFVVQNRDTTIEIRRRHENPTLWKKVAMAGGIVPSTSIATGSFDAAVGYGAAGTLRTAKIAANLIGYENVAISELNPDGVTVTEAITGKVLKGATHAIVAFVQNTHASAVAP